MEKYKIEYPPIYLGCHVSKDGRQKSEKYIKY
jgi:hypothetical protein